VAGEPDTIWTPAADAGAVIVLGHGAGSGMRSPFITGISDELARHRISVLRFDFPYVTAGRRVPDRAPVLVDATMRAFALGRERAGGLPLLAGGKSLGGRMASMAAADGMPAAGLVFLGYPLHPPGKPDKLRDAHLDAIRVPMMFVQGTNDAFARADLLAPVLERLGGRAALYSVPGGDHSFRVAGGPRDPAVIGAALAPAVAAFALALAD